MANRLELSGNSGLTRRTTPRDLIIPPEETEQFLQRISPSEPSLRMHEPVLGKGPEVGGGPVLAERGIPAGPEAEQYRIEHGLVPATTTEQKATRRQYLISQARKHGVPQDVLANQIRIEGVTDVVEKAVPTEAQVIETSEGIFQLDPQTGRFDIRVGGLPKKKTTTSSLAKLIDERASLKATGVPDDDPRIKAYDSKISGADKTGAQNFLLPNGDMVLSYDKGRTYTSRDGATLTIPPGTVKVPAGATMTGLRTQRAKQEAKEAIAGEEAKPPAMSAEEAARGGTGPYAMLKAAVDNVLGGIGIDAVFGQDGFFQDTQENRQALRAIKQIGKAALINSPRFPVAEQKTVDKLFATPDTFFTNPVTEANKFQVLRDVMKETRDFNNRAIVDASAKDVAKLKQSNREIDRFLSLIGEGEQTAAVTTVSSDADYDAVPSGSIYTAPDGSRRRKQ
jgi:hypothetical protein